MSNLDQLDNDADGTGDACDVDADGDGANGDGAGGASVTDANDLDANVTIDTDNDTIDDLVDNCLSAPNADQDNLDADAFGDACDIDADGDGFNGDGAGGPSVNDANDLDDTISVDADADGVDDTVDNCLGLSNTGQENLDGDEQGDACDTDIDGDTLVNAVDPDPLNSESMYHFDFFYNQLSSDINTFKAAVFSETVTQVDGAIDIGLVFGSDITSLDLGSDGDGIGSFNVRADYFTSEKSLISSGSAISTSAAILTEQRVTTAGIVNAVSLTNGLLSFNSGVRVGTPGFEFPGLDRTIYDPDINGDGAVTDDEFLAFYSDGIKSFGVNDTIDEILAGGTFSIGTNPTPDCPDINVMVDIYTQADGSCGEFFLINKAAGLTAWGNHNFIGSGRVIIEWRVNDVGYHSRGSIKFVIFCRRCFR